MLDAGALANRHLWTGSKGSSTCCAPPAVNRQGKAISSNRQGPTWLALPRSVVFVTPPTRTLTFL